MFVESANAHLVTRPKDDTLSARIASQTHNLAHARYVCNRGAGANQRWHCLATKWLERELNKSYAQQRAAEQRRLASSPAGIRALICQVFGAECAKAIRVVHCETGGTFNPRIIGNSRGADPYYGLFQFGAYARARYGFGWDARTQIVAAKRMRDAEGWRPWPVCGRL